MNLGNVVFGVFISCSMAFSLQGQSQPATPLADIVFLDSVVVRASRADFSVEEFIDLVRSDESFYLAFRNLRFASYLMQTDMTFLNKRDLIQTKVSAEHQQIHNGQCRWMTQLSQNIDGPYYKRKNRFKYYTTELYERLFISHDTICTDFNLDQPMLQVEDGGLEGHVGELKKLIFKPGSSSNVPLLGNKSEIFSDKMIKRYDFSIHSETFNGIEAYVFKAQIKPRFVDHSFNKTLIKSLVTYFSKADFQVLGRRYRLAQKAALYQFDVTMYIELELDNQHYYPSKIQYGGFWNIPTKRKEKGTFTILIDHFSMATPK